MYIERKLHIKIGGKIPWPYISVDPNLGKIHVGVARIEFSNIVTYVCS